MSIVIGETPKRQARDSALTASDDVELAASFPLTITLWVYFDEVPGENDTQTVLWYGEAPPVSNHVRLEATKNATSGIDLTATLAASAGTVSATATLIPVGAWIMATVIVEEVGGASHGVTLYIDASEEDSQTGSVGTTSPADYDTFLLGAAPGGSNFGRFHAEHVAIWAPDSGNPLSASDIGKLYDKRWAPFKYPEEPAPLDRVPGIAYWMLVGHWSAGIDADNDQGLPGLRGRGLLFNQANPVGITAKPQLAMLDTAKPVVWSAKTPVMRYKTPEQPMAPGPVVHPPIPPVSRLQPHFYVFNTTGELGTFKYGPLEIPVYTNANFIPKGASRNSNAQSAIVPLVSSLTDYLPRNDLALIAKRVADWFEFTGLTRGVGSVGDGLYEGWVILFGIGLGNIQVKDETVFLRGFRGTLVTPDGKFEGTKVQIPLEVHPLDMVAPSQTINPDWPWQTWFNAHGKRLVKDYMDGFWTALKRELDERDLCYPRVLWSDQEDWAAATKAVQSEETAPGVRVARGTFTLQRDDSRAATEPLMGNAALTTLDDIYDTTGPAYDDLKIPTDDYNQPFLTWYLGWSIPIGQQAMLEAMMAKAKELFSLAVWANYDRFSADSPGFRYQGDTQRMVYNTPPADEAEIHGDYSSPKLYTPNSLDKLTNASNRLMPELGVTYSQVMRNCHRSRIDACVNAFSEKRLVPYFETGNRSFALPAGSEGRYDLTNEDVFGVLAHAWKRGVTDFIPFVWTDPAPEDPEAGPGDHVSEATDDDKKLAHDRMYDVCFRLLNTVHWMPQENHARACRVSRLGW